MNDSSKQNSPTREMRERLKGAYFDEAGWAEYLDRLAFDRRVSELAEEMDFDEPMDFALRVILALAKRVDELQREHEDLEQELEDSRAGCIHCGGGGFVEVEGQETACMCPDGQVHKLKAELSAFKQALCQRGENPETLTPQKVQEFIEHVYDALAASMVSQTDLALRLQNAEAVINEVADIIHLHASDDRTVYGKVQIAAWRYLNKHAGDVTAVARGEGAASENNDTEDILLGRKKYHDG